MNKEIVDALDRISDLSGINRDDLSLSEFLNKIADHIEDSTIAKHDTQNIAVEYVEPTDIMPGESVVHGKYKITACQERDDARGCGGCSFRWDNYFEESICSGDPPIIENKILECSSPWRSDKTGIIFKIEEVK